ncbi:MAG TPA: hypothetical protein VJN64_03380 [Terriglobales bacterium]|nr:hypothetical protein [Terriglobales bacterium]
MKLTAIALLACLSLGTSAKKAPEESLTVKAVSHDVLLSASNGRHTTCYSGGPVVNCSTVGGFDWIDITEVVEAQGNRYTITCSGVPFRSAVYRYCEWLHFDGDEFPATIKKNQMTIRARKGGNQGKEIKLKFTIVDIRPETK